MLKAMSVLAIFGGLVFVGLGGIFLIAGGDDALTGVVLALLGMGLLGAAYMLARVDARRPVTVTQELSVQMSGSGEFRTREIQCPGCGGPVSEENLELVEGGLMVKCPYCHKVSILEEGPKW